MASEDLKTLVAREIASGETIAEVARRYDYSWKGMKKIAAQPALVPFEAAGGSRKRDPLRGGETRVVRLSSRHRPRVPRGVPGGSGAGGGTSPLFGWPA